MTDSQRKNDPNIEKRFTHHAPNKQQIERFQTIRIKAMGLAYTIFEHCPESREKSLALTKLEECVMWANASIAREDSWEGQRQ